MIKSALITGGTSGVGLSMVKALLQKEYNVFFIGSNIEKGMAIESELDKLYSNKAKFIQLDLSDIQKVKTFAINFREENEQLDVLANVAGVMIPKRLMTKYGIEKTFSIGYISAFILSNELAPLLEKVKGRIVNVAGVPSHILNINLNFDDLSFSKKYNGIKAAITAVHAKTVLTQILSEKYAIKNIDVNSFHPGFVRSDLMKNMNKIQRFIFKIAALFMSEKSETGIYVSSSLEINGVSGKLFTKKKTLNLNFKSDYKKKLWDTTIQLLAN